jgi:hypothetical protein
MVRAGWLALAGLLLATYAAGIPLRLRDLQAMTGEPSSMLSGGLPPALEAVAASRLGPAEAVALQALGLSPGLYAGYILTFDVGLALAGAAIGLFIFWRRPDDWMALWFSLILVLLGTNSVSPVVPLLGSVWPAATLMSTLAGLLGMVSNVHLLFVWPNGRFVPRWTLRLAAGFVGSLLVMVGYAGWHVVQAGPGGVLMGLALLSVEVPIWLGVLGVGIWSQVYRYRRVSGPVQRQQTKWVVVGLAAVALGFLLNAWLLFAAGQQSGLPRVLFNLVRAPLVSLCMVLLPICVAISIFRYRLWDIDVIIRRTLIYSSLTAALGLVYLSSVVVLQSLFGLVTGERQSELVTVLSTLGIAALFIPLRRRLQDGIDRYFFRRKYDAAQTLAAFAASVRDETNLERLATRLVNGVEETMQPAHVSLWMRASDESRPTPVVGQVTSPVGEALTSDDPRSG